MMKIAVIGGGPGGAFCSSILARKGFRVTLFDYRAAWEKPCGGGVTFKAIERYPFLREALHPRRVIQAIEVHSPRNQDVTVPLTSPLSIYSRNILNQIVLDLAVVSRSQFPSGTSSWIFEKSLTLADSNGSSKPRSGFLGWSRWCEQFCSKDSRVTFCGRRPDAHLWISLAC